MASATRPDGIEAIIAATDHIVVGALSDPDQAAVFGLERSATVESHPGRAQIVDTSGVHMVQVAELDAPLDAVLRTLVALTEDEK